MTDVISSWLHGMFGFPWVGVKRQEKVADGGLKLLAAKPQKFGLVEASTVTTKLKRKRRNNEEIATTLRKSKKRRPEYMSHVEVPRSVTHANTPDASILSLETHIFPENTKSTAGKGDQGLQSEQSLRTNQSPQTNRTLQTAQVSPMERPRVLYWDEGTEKETIMVWGEEQVAATLESARRLIERHFGLEILLKHRENRLIEQELAKAHIMYEQLRRCELIPYSQPTIQVRDVSAATGSHVLEGSQRQNLAPLPGVVDGPYTRHLAQWLLPDPPFDISETTSKTSKRASIKAPSKATSGAKAGPSTANSTATTTPSSRSQRGSNTSRLQSLLFNHAGTKEDKEQLIVRRPSDGQWLKIVCPYDGQMKFGNMQGFINHCRIRHKRYFLTHDEAAQACGHVVQHDESGVVVESPGFDVVHPVKNSTSYESAVAARLPITSTTTSNDKRKRAPSQSEDLDGASNEQNLHQSCSSTHAPDNASNTQPSTSSPTTSFFIPSSLTPSLSALFTKRGKGGDLKQLVDEAKIKVVETATKVDQAKKGSARSKSQFGFDGVYEHENDDGDDEDDKEEDNSEPEASQPSFSTAEGRVRGRILPRSTMSPAPLDRPSSDKGLNGQARRPGKLNTHIPQPYHASEVHDQLSNSRALNLSPNTVESNPAPSLVSDDGDYEDAHESEAPSSAGEDDQDSYLDVEVEEEVCSSSADPELAAAKKARPTVRRGSALTRQASTQGGQGTRRVSFASPVKGE